MRFATTNLRSVRHKSAALSDLMLSKHIDILALTETWLSASDTSACLADICSDKGGLHIDEKIVGLSISQWLPCPLAVWNLLFEMAILLNLVKYGFCLNHHPRHSGRGGGVACLVPET